MGRIERRSVNEPDMALGQASDIMVSITTRILLEDGALRFESRGAQHLKGIPTPLEVFALVD
jgi:class 3 adenylate cyclase